MREIRIIHLQRSGGHAIAQWLLNQIAANTTFINDVCHRDKIAQWSQRLPRIPANTQWLLCNVEDRPLEQIDPLLTAASRFVPVMRDQNPIYILVLRDIYNTMASRWQYGKNGNLCQLGNCGPVVTKTWIQQAKVGFLLQHGVAHRMTLQQMFLLNFDRWASEPAYREAVWLSLSMRDDGPPGAYKPDAHQKISTWGGGSSFDGITTKSDEMHINDRYRQVPPEAFEDITPEASFWNRAIFGWSLFE